MPVKIEQIIAFCWILIIGAFYLAAFPVKELFAGLPSIGVFSPSFRLLEHVFCLLLILIAANGLASFIWFSSRLSHLEKLLFATSAGLGIISIIVFLLSFACINCTFLYFFILLAGFILLILCGKQFHSRVSSRLWLLIAISSAPLISTLIGALAPPTQFDSLVYHLALPSKYILKGRMFAVPGNFFFTFPQNMEMLFQLAMAVDSDILANLLHWVFLPLTGFAIYSFCLRFYNNSKLGVIAAVIWLCTPAAMFVSTGTYVDLALTFYVLINLYAFLLWKDQKRTKLLFMCALFSGLACGIKYTAAINVIIMALLILFSENFHKHDAQTDSAVDTNSDVNNLPQTNNVKRDTFSCRFKAAGQYLLIVLLVFSPWLVKNIIFAHNPVSRWGTGVFKDTLVTSVQASSYFNHISGHGVNITGPLDILALPWHITFTGYKFGGGFDILGPVFLLFLPILFLNLKLDKIDKILVIYSVSFIIFWLCTGKVMRFLLPTIPFLCIFCARAIGSAFPDDSRKYLKFAVYSLLAAALAHNLLLFHWVMASVDPYSAVFGKLSGKQYLTNKLNYFKAVDTEVNKLPIGSKTVFLGETRGYYCSADSIVPTDFDSNPLIEYANSAASENELRKFLRRGGITHILLNNYEYERLSVKSRFNAKGLLNFQRLIDYSSRTIFEDKYTKLYELTN